MNFPLERLVLILSQPDSESIVDPVKSKLMALKCQTVIIKAHFKTANLKMKDEGKAKDSRR